jgi:hypothetical protein
MSRPAVLENVRLEYEYYGGPTMTLREKLRILFTKL